ncbi:MAG TPA: T9SS type A sorting domain-containing protein, partial [Cytophagaceae bacterium]
NKLATAFYNAVKTQLGGGSPVITDLGSQKENLSLKLYPNPAIHEVSISLAEFTAESAVRVTMSDLAGKPFIDKEVQLGAGVDQVTLPVSHLPQGLFLVAIQGGKVSKKSTLVITK